MSGSEQNYRVSKSAIPMLFNAQKTVSLAFDIKRLIFELKSQIWHQGVEVTEQELEDILKLGQYDNLDVGDQLIDW